MSTYAFRLLDQPATPAPAAKPSSSRNALLRAGGVILGTVAALTTLAALVVVVRVAIYTAAHGDQPFIHTLIERLTS
jgi:hypothetical protein